MKVTIAFLVLALATVVLGAGKCPTSYAEFDKKADVCLEPFAEFAGKNAKMDRARVCKVYNHCKPCMNDITGNCKSTKAFETNELWKLWNQLKPLDKMC